MTIAENSFDVIAITETWLNDNIDDKGLALQGYRLFRRDRAYPSGLAVPSATHEVCLYVRHDIGVTLVDLVIYLSLSFSSLGAKNATSKSCSTDSTRKVLRS